VYRLRQKIDVLYAHTSHFPNPTAGRIQELDHRLISHASSELDELCDVTDRNHLRKRPNHLSSTDDPGRDRIDEAADVKEIKEPAQSVKMTIETVHTEIPFHLMN
jgi:hypothetical protein